MNPSDWVVAMDEAGQQLDSKGMSAELNRWRDMGRDIVFLIGGANGLSRIYWIGPISAYHFPL